MRLVENKTTTDWTKKKERITLIKMIATMALYSIRQQIKDKLKQDGDNRFFTFINMYLDVSLYKQKKIGFYGTCGGCPAYCASFILERDIEDFTNVYNDLFFFMEGFNETLRT